MSDPRMTRDAPGFGRDEDLEATRRRDRPAQADLEADAEGAAREPKITVSPDPDDES